MICADWHHWTTQYVSTAFFFLPFPPSSLILHYTFFLVLQAMLSSILSCACNFSSHDTILIFTVTTNTDVWELMFVRATERSNWPGEHRCLCPQRTQAHSSAKWGYTDSEREYRTSEGLHCLHFLFLYNCLSDMLSIWSWFAFLFFICHAKVPVPPPKSTALNTPSFSLTTRVVCLSSGTCHILERQASY